MERNFTDIVHPHVLTKERIPYCSTWELRKGSSTYITKKEENGLALNKPLISKSAVPHALNSKESDEDKQLREQILSRYAYIDQDDDYREHKPIIPKTEPKKLIRYRDNKIVSIKGERYSEVKRAQEGKFLCSLIL
ncbi:CUE domain-containing protein 2 [Caerostris extrusa]|uniref:CUE domain-containing protein 2 n=1 Tax=Caerostris extrusa TaxID=172846 RepID=A0AAV4RD01_CAEEX|nr:CUE domain-containing protein 2 [Caerostris extrusa]